MTRCPPEKGRTSGGWRWRTPPPRRTERVPGSRARGFTLLELLVVIAIIGVVLAVVPAFVLRDHASSELDAVARTIADALRRTRSEAIVQNREQTFILDVANRRMRAGSGEPPIQLDENVRLELRTARSEQLGESTAAIRFFPDGGATGGRIGVALDRYQAAVTIDWLTGRVSTHGAVADD